MADTIRTRRIEICDEAGNVRATLSAGKDVGGLWIENEKGHTLAIWTDEGCAAIGVYVPGNRASCDVSISVDTAGKVHMQHRHADGTIHVRELGPEPV